MTFHFRTTILDLARVAANLGVLRRRSAAARRIAGAGGCRSRAHEWRCIAERTIPPDEMAPGARVFRYRS